MIIFYQAERLQLKRVDEVDTDLNIPVPEPITLENGVRFFFFFFFLHLTGRHKGTWII